MSRKWSDSASAMAMRDTIEKIAFGVLRREYPKSFAAEVYDFNIFTHKALVRTAGMSETEDPIQVSFTEQFHPNVVHDPVTGFPGTIVEVEGQPGSYWIKKILGGEWRSAFGRIVNARFNGGAYSHIERESQHVVEVNLPGTGNTISLGFWSNQNLTPTSAGMANLKLKVTQDTATSIIKTYDIPLANHAEGGVWKTLAPDSDSGAHDGNDFAVEIKVIADQGFYLRIRRLYAGVNPPGGYIADLQILGNLFYWDSTTHNLEEFDARPGEFYGRDQVATSDTIAGQVNQGPFFDSFTHAVETQVALNMMPPQSIQWDGTRLKWVSEFRVGGIGKGDLSSNGRILIACPADGVVIPVHGSTAATSSTVNADGIDMKTEASYMTLYYEPIFFGSGNGNTGRFHIVGTTKEFHVPSHWIMVAAAHANNHPGNSLKLGTGQIMDHWRDPGALSNGWTNYGSGYAPIGYKKEGTKVSFRGAGVGGTYGSSVNLFTLPTGFRPEFLTTLTAYPISRIDVTTAGVFQYKNAAGSGAHSFDGLSFEAYQ